MNACSASRRRIGSSLRSVLYIATVAGTVSCAGTVPPPAVAARPSSPLVRSVAPPPTNSAPQTVLPEIASPEEGIATVRQAIASGDGTTAERYARGVIRRFPDTIWHKRALFLLGRALISLDRTAEADAVLLRIPTEYPDLADYALFLLAEHHAAKQRSAEAVDRYQRLIGAYPASSLVPRALTRKGQVLFDAGLLRESAAVFEQVLTDHSWSEQAPEAGIGLGKARAAAGDLTGAARALLDVSIRYPAGGQADEAEVLLASLRERGAAVPVLTADEHYARARELYRAAQHDKAYVSFTKALEADPAHPQRADIMLRTGIALFHLGRRAEAASMLERLLKAKMPDCRCAEALNWLGRSYGRLGLREEAVDAFRELVRLYPGSDWADDALYHIGNVHRDAGNMKTALMYYRRLVAEYPDSSLADSALWWEGWEYYSALQDRKAIDAFQELIRRYPRSFLVNQALYWQGRAAERIGDQEQAAKYYERLLRRGPYTYYGYHAQERLAAKDGPDATIVEAFDEKQAVEAENEQSAALDEEFADPADPPDWAEDVLAALSSNPVYRKPLELMQVGMKAEAASELALLQGLLPRRYGALMGVSKAFFELGDYYRSLVIILRNFERLLERPSMRFPEELWLLAYPQGYWTSILNSSRKYGIDPYFIAAIIRQESQFRTEALSPAGALGIMQVMPKTGEWIARSAGLSGFDRSRLFDADVNISLGAWYLSFLMKRFQGDLYLVSAAYNAGPEVVRAWAGKDGVASDPAVFVETIPYSETRGYVKKVLRNYAEYRRIYSGNGAMPAPSSPPSGKHPDEEGNAAGLQWCSSAEACP